MSILLSMKQITLFGASGKTGALVLERLLAAGHGVTVLVRNPEKLALQHGSLRVVQGDAMNLTDVEWALEGSTAVLSVLGMASLKPSTIMGTGVGNIVRAMEAKGIKRVISVATAGIFHEMGGGIGGFITGIFLKNAIKDHRQAYKVLAESTLDWTVVRPLGLLDSPRTGSYRLAKEGIPPKSRTVTRADLADFLVETLAQDLFIRESPAIAT